jgi:hypothetical protein
MYMMSLGHIHVDPCDAMRVHKKKGIQTNATLAQYYQVNASEYIGRVAEESVGNRLAARVAKVADESVEYRLPAYIGNVVSELEGLGRPVFVGNAAVM